VNIFLSGADRSTASAIKGAIMYRIEQMLLDCPDLEALQDSGGERAFHGRIVKENGFLGGDKRRTPIWRHKIWIEFQTIRRR
jgi:hypothetical protein